jgi:hypothetical protein
MDVVSYYTQYQLPGASFRRNKRAAASPHSPCTLKENRYAPTVASVVRCLCAAAAPPPHHAREWSLLPFARE